MVSTLVAPKMVDIIRRSLPEGLRADFDADVRRTETPRLQTVLRLWRARGAARNDPDRIRRLQSAVRTDPDSGAVTWTADPDEPAR
ncbi:hypothetical protein [Yinghuangia seranimata]|uniref:hypothetical protein n=1 Tax=Yinghuangia seranimata TaxID=408067 RepID=UPI00248D26FB|nr:hypothetical protein [Yinghuangia seranimata]MDI2130978.1 hypothetical protein [Yinghuangia seranimata]